MSPMASFGEFKVSERGQMSLPAAARRRWGIEDGGVVEIVDLGDSLLVLPGRNATWRILGEAVDEAGGYAALAREVAASDPDLA